ncbi:type II secretion system F family protein [soil metagenome]
MLAYHYTARDTASGNKVSAEVQAESEQAAAKLIKQQGLAPLEIKAKDVNAKGLDKLLKRVKTRDRILFSRQLSTLINAGLPLLQSLRNVGNQTENKQLKYIISKISSDIEAGSSFANALSRHTDVFNQVYISLVEAGEASGTLDKSLQRLADQQEKDAEIISKVRGAMIYPIVVLLVMVGVVTFMLVAVLPQVRELYDGLSGVQLPILTRVLLAISDFLVNYWWVFLILLGVASFFTGRWARSLGGKRIIDKAKMKAWPVGELFMKMYMARFARTGTTLVSTGVPLIQMLEITSKAVNNYHIEKSLERAIDQVRGGKALSDALEHDENFLSLVPNMLRIGEQSGAIEDMLAKTADYYEKEVDNQIKTISTIIEPVLMIVLGVVALTIVAAILLPIYGLVGTEAFN